MMSPQQTPSPDEARTSLDQISASRRAAAGVLRRPLWIDLGMATTVGLTLALGPAGHQVAALVVLVVGSAVFAIAQRRLARGHGQVLDERALGARILRFALLYAVIFVGLQFGPTTWQPWYSIGLGLVTAVGAFSWLRWEERYRIKRLSAGDYGRYDLL